MSVSKKDQALNPSCFLLSVCLNSNGQAHVTCYFSLLFLESFIAGWWSAPRIMSESA